MLGSVKAGRFLGIDIYLHWTFWILFSWLMFVFATVFTSPKMGLPLVLQLFFTILAVFLLFFSIFCHEYAHCLMARCYDIRTNRITVLGCGMVAQLDFDKVYERGPGTEFKIAVVGPLVSLLLSVFFFFAYTLFLHWVPEKFTLVGGSIYDPIGIIFYVLIRLNIIVALFNFLPSFPMDGGRVFRAFLWWLKKDLVWATKIACRVGLIMVLTVFPAVGYFISGSWISVIILICIGVFLLIPAGRAELKRAEDINKL